jgi:succinyl-CoA synthetase beta subunit
VPTGEVVASVTRGKPGRAVLGDKVDLHVIGIKRATDNLRDHAVPKIDAGAKHEFRLPAGGLPGAYRLLSPAAGTLTDVNSAAATETRTLSESESKQLLATAGVPVAAEAVVDTVAEAVEAATRTGFPVVLKLNGATIAHKTERGLVRLNLGDAAAVALAGEELLAKATAADGKVGLLVAPLVRGNRELIAGVATDPQFGRTVMIGIGGIFAEALADVAFRLVPLTRVDAEDMIDDLATQALLGAFRGEPAVDREALVDVLVGLSKLVEQRPDIVSVDVNPLIVSATNGKPIAVDGLVEVTK